MTDTHVGEASAMPGSNGGFTMAVFHGDNVPVGTKLYTSPQSGALKDSDVEWVVNDNAELGVKIGNQFFWCYKGESLVYKDGLHDDYTPILWRHVLKREFGECIHPVNYGDPRKVGTVDVNDGLEWKQVPAVTEIKEG